MPRDRQGDSVNFHVVAEYWLRTETSDEVLGHLARLAAASRNEPANLGYEYFRNVRNSLHVTILETYLDEAGFDAHRVSSHFEEIGKGKILPLLTERVVRTYTHEATT
ncbi:hypothetical protein A2J03_27495 [Rhodococcus sp. EPR-157]|uniref:putative quinol monooxygenase n=1 Tax=Rhodococcus sp. EPR-157 TaxID=1813677 RepID=UPI0007BB09B6|nr:hypothetical protein A2J03_27495 [Rhodococcus sp. EPR-157]